MKTVPVILHLQESDQFDGAFIGLQRYLASRGGYATLGIKHGTNCRAKRLDLAEVIPMHRAPRWPGVAPEGAA